MDPAESFEEQSRRAIEDELQGVVGLYTNPDIETTAVCDLSRQLTIPNPLQDNQTLATRDDLISYAYLFGITPEGLSDEQLAEEIRTKAPCDWINRVYDWARQDTQAAYHFNRYVTDIMMGVLTRVREGRSLTPEDQALLRGVGDAVGRSPRPERGFNVYRGSYTPPGQPGEIITLDTPKSGSFSLVPVLSGYLGSQTCCLMEIYVPAGAAVSYHPSEDQVIFPKGAEFYILSGPFVKTYPAFGEQHDLETYHVIYIGNLGFLPLKRPSSIYDKLPLTDAYYLAVLRRLPFPYGRDPAGALDAADKRDPNYLRKILSGDISLTPSEIRFYLLTKGYDVTSAANYDLDQMLEVLRQIGLLSI